MKTIKKTMRPILAMIIIMIQVTSISADNSNSNRQGNPMQVLDNFGRAVNDGTRVQDTAINDITDKQGQYASEYKFANTLDSIRIQIAPYLQWTMYLGLSFAVLGIIYNGFLMVTNSLHGNGDTTKVKDRIINLSIGVGLLTGFYVIIQLLLAIISYLQQ